MLNNCVSRPPMKLREGNVFTGICQSFYSQGSGRVSLVPGSFIVPGPMSFLGSRVSLVPCSLGGRGRVSLVPCSFKGIGYLWYYIPFCEYGISDPMSFLGVYLTSWVLYLLGYPPLQIPYSSGYPIPEPQKRAVLILLECALVSLDFYHVLLCKWFLSLQLSSKNIRSPM